MEPRPAGARLDRSHHVHTPEEPLASADQTLEDQHEDGEDGQEDEDEEGGHEVAEGEGLEAFLGTAAARTRSPPSPVPLEDARVTQTHHAVRRERGGG